MSRTSANLSSITLLIGIIALGLAIIPRAAFNVPPPWPTVPPQKPQEITEGGESYEWKGIKVTVGGTKKIIPPPPAPPVPPISVVFATATTIVSLIGLGMGVFACWSERIYILAVPGIALCSTAILWHYILLGVAAGFAIIIVVLVLIALANGGLS